jgi:hypothetical protein
MCLRAENPPKASETKSETEPLVISHAKVATHFETLAAREQHVTDFSPTLLV